MKPDRFVPDLLSHSLPHVPKRGSFECMITVWRLPLLLADPGCSHLQLCSSAVWWPCILPAINRVPGSLFSRRNARSSPNSSLLCQNSQLSEILLQSMATELNVKSTLIVRAIYAVSSLCKPFTLCFASFRALLLPVAIAEHDTDSF